MLKNKRGLTPIVATILLVALVVIIAVIILIWARSAIDESIEKSYGGNAERIENFCDDVSFSTDIYLKDGTGTPKKSARLVIDLTNKGDVPLYGVQIKKKKAGSKINAGLAVPDYGVKSGETQKIGDFSIGIEFEEQDDLIISPVLLGEVGDNKKYYICGDDYGLEEKVKAA